MQVACRPPSLRSRVYILDPLLEVSQCSGEGVGHVQGFRLTLLLPEVSSAAYAASLTCSVTCFQSSSSGTGIPGMAVLVCPLHAPSLQPANF